jgi:phage terminase large subunit
MNHVTAEFPAKLEFLFKPSRWKVAYGGRAGMKSWGCARALLILGAQKPMRILCCREIQKSIADSVHHLLKKQIELLGLSGFYAVLDNSIRGRNGTEFIFSGLRALNIESVKSKEDIDIAFVEEAQSVSEKSWEVLIPTIRKPGSEIWSIFNPDLDTDPTYKRFVISPPANAQIVQIGWQDNPWLSVESRADKDADYARDPESADHIWGGKTRRNSAACVLRGRYRVESFEPQPNWNGPMYGADWGFGVSPTVLIKCWVDKRTLYIEHEAFGNQIDVEDTPELFAKVPGAKEHLIRADCARPETISHMQQHGYPKMYACKKWQGSVEDGTEHLRSYETIIIHPRCVHAHDQARLWSWKVDNLTGDVLPTLVDKYDDVWDATRYALEPIIRAGKPDKKPLEPAKKKDGWAVDEKKKKDWMAM